MGLKHRFFVVSAFAFLASTAHADDFQRETTPEELATAAAKILPARPVEVRSVMLRSFDKIENGCRDIEKTAQKARAAIIENDSKLKTLKQVYSKMAKAVEGRDTKLFLKHYFAEEVAVRTDSVKKALNVVEGDGHMQMMDMLSLLIFQARTLERFDAKESTPGTRIEIAKMISGHCGIDDFTNALQIDGTKKKNRTELENSSRRILRLTILPEAAKNTPVFCSEQLLQAQINFDALSNEEFIAHGLDVLEKQHAIRVVPIMASPERVGEILFDSAKRVDVKQGDVLHSRAYAAHRKTVDRFVAVAVENIETVMEIDRLQDEQSRLQGVIGGTEEAKTEFGFQFQNLSRQLNNGREASPNFKPCAK